MRVKKVVSFILAVILVVSVVVVPAGASSSSGSWASCKEALYNIILSYYKIPLEYDDLPDFTFTKVGPVTLDELDLQCSYYNSVYGTLLKNWCLAEGIAEVFFGGHCMPKPDYDLGITRPMDMKTGEWVVDKDGNYPYYNGIGDVEASDPSPSDPYVNNWWLTGELAPTVKPMSYSELESLGSSLSAGGHECRLVSTLLFGTRCWVIQDYSTDGGANRIYGDLNAQAYVSYDEPSVTDNKYDYIAGDNVVINDSQILDIENGQFTIIDDDGTKLVLDIDNLTFDTGSKSYTINAYTTNIKGDEYYYTYYTYNITYNITNTYVTYIGSNDAYEKEEYEYYYQLPDGRSSADLTADEVAGMSFEFHDVVNYARSATDVSVRALYHFDGDLEDSSYFSTQGKFDWTSGASITYMEAPEAFDGTLYLDNTAHSFDITLPSVMGSSDYTIQFRYYQASEPDTQDNIDNSIQIGNTYVLCWDEKTVSRDPNGEYATWSLPIGTWNEIALVRHDGKLYVYLNGLCVSQEAYITSWGDIITFNFGSTSRAYSMIDELRVLNFALAEDGVTYTPSAVPHDSNLVLVLPDSARPIADEYYEVVPVGTDLFGGRYDFTGLSVGDSLSGYFSASASTSTPFPLSHDITKLSYRSQYTTVTAGNGYMSLAVSNINDIHVPTGGLAVATGATLSPNTTYTLTLVMSDYTLRTLTFTTTDSSSVNSDFYVHQRADSATDSIVRSMSFDGGVFQNRVFVTGLNSNGSWLHCSGIVLRPASTTGSLDIAYMTLTQGSEAGVTLEKVTCIYPEITMQPNTAAVQSEIPVKGYTVGGVRPTLPAKGDCWFPVFEGRIQTCYIYTGSMWEEVGCRWYTGSRWIPIYAFDLTTLEDLFDIADSADVIVPIPNESGFWRWWQLQWLDFRNYLDGKFDELIAAITGGSIGSGPDITVPDEEGNSKFSFSDLVGAVLSSLLEVATTVLTEFIGLIADLIKMFIQAVMDFIGGFVGVLSDAAGHIATLGDNVAPIGDFVSGIYAAIPDPIEDVLTGSFVVIVAVSVISFLL